MSKKNRYNEFSTPVETAEEVSEAVIEETEESAPVEEAAEESVSVPVVEEPTEPTIKHGTVDFAAFVNLRRQARHDGEVIESLPKGTMVTLKNLVGGYYEVELNDGRNGYISSQYLAVQ